MAGLGAVGIRSDPAMGYNFMINLIDTSSSMAIATSALKSAVFDVLLGGFTECTGLDTALEVEDYKEGGNNGAVLHFPTRVTWSNLVLKKGAGGTALWDWHADFTQGRGKRRDGVITLMNDLHLPTNIWYFRRGLPVRYSGPSMNAGQSQVVIESIEIAHEGIYQVPYVGLATSALTTGISAGVKAFG